jgi:hypothetical protein
LIRRDARDDWTTTDAGAGESIGLESTGGRLAADDVYRDGLEIAGGSGSGPSWALHRRARQSPRTPVRARTDIRCPRAPSDGQTAKARRFSLARSVLNRPDEGQQTGQQPTRGQGSWTFRPS